ncbi:MAG: biotin--[acetyl-CoA-carboxylase] ligase [Chloroflexota bacterium]
MNQDTLEKSLNNLALGELRFLTSVGSTNVEAAEWAARGAPHLSLVAADQQTAGRGRAGRKWFTPPGAALAFSLILRADALRISKTEKIARMTGLGAVAVSQALEQHYGLDAKIKWPNDILLSGRKAAGVLSEASWTGDQLSALILGVGINVASSAVPPDDWDADHAHPFPATSVEGALEGPVNREKLLHSVLEALLDWLPQWESAAFFDAWRKRLAMRDAWVQILQSSGTNSKDESALEGQIITLNEDGSLRIRLRSGSQRNVRVGDIHLRSVDSSSK